MLTQAEVRHLFDYDYSTGKLTWRIRAARNVFPGQSAGYNRQVRINRHAYIKTHVIWLWVTGQWPKSTIDHRDLDHENNSWGNLREATYGENNANRRNYKPQGLKWVRQMKRAGWGYQVQINGVPFRKSGFKTEQDAHDAAYALAKRLHGAFVQP
jgi:HNH endonuclease